ncbi:MAG: trypsin-like serine protease [Cyanobacteria bacterium J06642_11]
MAATPSQAMVIRHDVAPEHYLVNEADYPAIFPVLEDGNIKDCVATVVDPQWAMTAAHCLASLYAQDFERNPYRVTIAGLENVVTDVVVPEEFGTFEVIRDVDGNFINFDFDPDELDLSYDVALMRLRDNVDHVTPIDIYRDDDEVGQIVTLLGWGNFGTGDVGLSSTNPVNDGQFRQATNQITGTQGNYLTFEFDDPSAGSALPLEGVNGPGDSGGPALVDTVNGPRIIGISSRGAYADDDDNPRQGRYGWQEFYVRTSQTQDWIDQVIDETPSSSPQSVPEPTTILGLLGMASVVGLRRKL